MSGVARFAPRPKLLLLVLLGTTVVVGALLAVAYADTSIPSPSTIASAQTTTFYYNDGRSVIAHVGETNRTDVTLSQVPISTQHAVLAAEDRHFYSEPGVSITGITRALIVDIRGGDITQGGSTITQQYAKQAYLSTQRSFTRKLKEIFIATKLGQTRSKSSVLTDYLNTIYFGRNAYGIQAAAQAYFGRNVSHLTVAQSALLAAVIRGPSIYDPRVNPSAAQARWRYVVKGMVSQGWLTQSQADSLRFPSTVTVSSGKSCGDGPTAFVCLAVEAQLTRDGISHQQLDVGGLKVTTTLDKTAQAAAVSAENALVGNAHGKPESGLISVKPGDGAIEAMYGGPRYGDPKNRRDGSQDLSGAEHTTASYTRPPGSSMKPYTLIAALKKGISLSSVYPGPSHIPFPGTTNGISNSGGESCSSPCTLTKALAESINTVFVPLAQQVGPTNVDQVAYDSGVTNYGGNRALSTTPEVTLGTEGVSVLDQATGYATIAAKGIEATPYLVSKVTTADGTKLFTAHPQTKRAYSTAIASDATYAMTKVLDCSYGGTACGKALPGRPAAGKTGTTTANADAWFIGFTPQLSTAVWLGNADRTSPVTSGGAEVFGGDKPAMIWQRMMTGALAGQPVVDFPPPANVGVTQNSSSPSPSTTTSPSSSTTPSTSPSVTAPVSPPPSSPLISPSPPVTPPVSASPGGAAPARSRSPARSG